MSLSCGGMDCAGWDWAGGGCCVGTCPLTVLRWCRRGCVVWGIVGESFGVCGVVPLLMVSGNVWWFVVAGGLFLHCVGDQSCGDCVWGWGRHCVFPLEVSHLNH